jgi:site-specific DNA recombinase
VANLVSRNSDERWHGGLAQSNLQPLLPDNARIQDSKRLILTEFIPLQMKRRGVETKLVVENQSKNVTRTDPALLRAVARGHRWFAELAAGTAGSTIEIAKREGVNDSYVRRLIPLAFLSPAIIEAICAGRQPLDLSAEKLRRAAPLPLEWREQQRRLGLE